jgi:hypothetical protein
MGQAIGTICVCCRAGQGGRGASVGMLQNIEAVIRLQAMVVGKNLVGSPTVEKKVDATKAPTIQNH